MGKLIQWDLKCLFLLQEAGTARPSITTSLLEEKFNADGLDREEIIKNCGGVVYSGTICSVFFLFVVFKHAIFLIAGADTVCYPFLFLSAYKH